MAEKDNRNEWAQFRFGVIAPLVCRRLDEAERRQLKREILNQLFVNPDGLEKRVAERTLREWVSRYRLYGFDGLLRLKRSDRGVHTAISEEIIKEAYVLRKELPTRSIKGILAHFRARGVDVGSVSKTTLNRHLNSLGAKKEKATSGQKGVFQRWQKEHANDLWQADTSAGIWLPNPSNPKEYKQTRLISFIDDATRVCPHAEFYFDEQLPSLIDCFRKAMLKRGKPCKLLADNAFIYHSKAMSRACAQLKIEPKFCQAFDPPGKGKVEKSYGYYKASFYKEAEKAGLRSLDELNKFWFAWLTREYHHAEHSELKMTPIQRWKIDEDNGFVKRVTAEEIRRALMLRETRSVHIRTGTIRLNNRSYQLSPEFAGRKVEVLFEANKPCDSVEIWLDGKMVELAKEIVPGADIDFTRKREKKVENKHSVLASAKEYRQALVAAHQSETPMLLGNGSDEYMAEPEFLTLLKRLLAREFTEEERVYLSAFFFENAPMTERRAEFLLAQVVNAKGGDLHLRSYCSHLKQGLYQQRS